jgi:hypothetical protein
MTGDGDPQGSGRRDAALTYSWNKHFLDAIIIVVFAVGQSPTEPARATLQWRNMLHTSIAIIVDC